MIKFKYWIELIGIIIAFFLIFFWYNFFSFNDGVDWDTRAKLGDSFGSLNALFSGLALAGIVFTVLLQRKELSLQRDELKETRKEFQIQNKTLKIQRFENTFFNLMGLHHKIVDSIDYQEQLELKDASETLRIIKSSGLSGGNNDNKNFVLNNITGRDVFRDKFYLLSTAINKKIETFELPDSYTFTSIRDGIEPFELNHVKTTFEPIFFNHYNAVKTDFGHYFRNLYRIVKFVDESILISDDEIEFKKTVSNDDKREILAEENFKLKYSYTSMLRAQLSDYELGWIFYNCISSNGSKKFMPLINKYAILKNLNWLDYHPNYICIYQKTAYINPLES